jgi:hypothetical protein
MRYSYMMSKISTWGISAAAVYLLLVAALFLYAKSCTETFCGLVALLAGLPWLPLLDFLGGDSYASGAYSWLSIILNIFVLYFLFATIQRWVKR